MGVDVQDKYVDKTNLNTGGQPTLGEERKRRGGGEGGICTWRSKGPMRPFRNWGLSRAWTHLLLLIEV
jgi:hypothetical protein